MKTLRILRRSLAALLALTLVFMFAACGNKQTATGGTTTDDSTKAAAGGTIKFAVVGPMTGDGAVMGEHQKLGVQCAVDEINAAGGINGKKLEFEVFDDQGLPNQALLVAQKIVNDKDIKFVVGHINSGCSLAALPTYAKIDLPLVSGTNSAASVTQQGYTNYARICMTDEMYVSIQVDFAITELGFKKPVVMYENTDFGKGGNAVAVKRLKELGVPLLADVSYVPSTDRDFSSQITTFKGVNADCVIFIGEYTATSVFLTQAKGLGLKSTFVGTPSCANPEVLKLAGEAANGMYTMTLFNPEDTAKSPKVAPFVEAYTKLSGGTKPAEWSAMAYDVIYMYAEALKTNPKDGKEIMAALKALPAYEGVTGISKFDEKGDVTGKVPALLVVKDGKQIPYTPTKMKLGG